MQRNFGKKFFSRNLKHFARISPNQNLWRCAYIHCTPALTPVADGHNAVTTIITRFTEHAKSYEVLKHFIQNSKLVNLVNSRFFIHVAVQPLQILCGHHLNTKIVSCEMSMRHYQHWCYTNFEFKPIRIISKIFTMLVL